ncbi:unnamed protein product (macronuclear) [Paramecium tetraurelia]|uniref:Uncharacterized protein n=1 Tax=Paramecium tetraurelia TaxID=5888 RepID=A0C313_PARTE|nr:uncharacterized protein GSPATT00034658001 [Paramecium tetraurelia]CAK65180.1 unnamed protein product [Paramecium tetraurelia]|eukprot:XP_001432577.1 hypothetical protein (macronuclear) [Paramecium tetraurelia strain d4-2]
MEKELAHKLDVILKKLSDDVLTIEQDKLQHVFHSVHTISWIVIQSIVPYIREEFRGQTIKVFQLITQLIKCLKDNDFDEVTKKLFQQRAQRRRSLRLINCSLCDHYRKMPSKQDSKQAHYKKYLDQLKRDGVELNSKMDHVVLERKIRKLSDDEDQFVYKTSKACQVELDELLLQNSNSNENENQRISKSDTFDAETQTESVPSKFSLQATSELRNHFVNYYYLHSQYDSVKQIIDEGIQACQKQTEIFQDVNQDTPALKVKYFAQQSLQHVSQVLQQKIAQIEATKEFKSKELKENLPPLGDIIKQVQLQEHKRKAIEAGIIEYDPEFDPELLQNKRIEFRVKEINGQQVIEEVVVDVESGEVIKSRARQSDPQQEIMLEQEELIKQIKSKEQTIDENEWIVAKYGNQKVKVIQKSDDVTQYEVNTAQAKKIVRVKSVDGNKQLEEEWIAQQADGKHQYKVYQQNGQLLYEDKGQSVGIRLSAKRLDHKESIIEERTTENGSVMRILEKQKYGQDTLKIIRRNSKHEVVESITKQVLKDDNGEMYQHEEEVKQGGVKIMRKIYVNGDDQSKKIDEITIHPNGRRSSIVLKQYKDKTEAVFNDEFGDEIQVTKYTYINEKGQQVECQRKMNMRTKEVQMQKTFKNEDGKQTIETVITLDGLEIGKQIIIQVGPNERIERITKYGKTIEQKVLVDEHGQESIHMVDHENNMKIQTTNFTKNSVEYQQQTINLSNGAKRHIHQRSYFDENNEKIIEEDRVDEFGQRILIKKRINALGEEIIQEFEVMENDGLNPELKQIRQSQKRLPRAELQSVVVIDIGIQTEGQMPLFTQTQEQFQQKKQNSQIIIDKPDFNELDKEAFKKLQQGKGKNDPQFQEAVNQIKKFFNKGEGEEIKQEEFNEYLSKLRQNHQRQCGEQCSHLLRFYAKLGFLIQKSALNRQVYKLQKVQLQAKESL